MRIAICYDSYYLNQEIHSKYTEVFCKGLKTLGHEVSVFTCEPGAKKISKNEGNYIFPGRKTNSYFKTGLSLFAFNKLKISMAEFSPDVIMVFGATLLSYKASKFAKRSGIPLVACIQSLKDCFTGDSENNISRELLSVIYRLFSKKIFTKCDKILSFSEKVINDLEVLKIDKNVEIMPLCINSDSFHNQETESKKIEEFKKAIGISDNKSGILYSGDLSDRAALEYLFETWSGCVTPSDNLKLIVSGSGITKEALFEMAKINGVTNKISFIEGDDAEKDALCFGACDAFLVPANKNHTYIAPYNALACGLPILIHESSVSVYLVRDGINGFIYKNNAELRKILQKFTQLDSESRVVLHEFIKKKAIEKDEIYAGRYLEDVFFELTEKS